MKKNLNIIVLALLISSCREAEPALFLLPAGYEGPIAVVFDQPNGTEVEYEEDTRVYRIPPNGVLHTKFSPNPGISNDHFYYVDGDDNRIEIPYEYTKDGLRLNPADLQVFAGAVGQRSNENRTIVYEHYVVGTRVYLGHLNLDTFPPVPED